jgi:hypothetical protein
MPRTKKFASKRKFRGNKPVCVNKNTGVSEKGECVSHQSGEGSCVKHNLTASNKKMHGSSVNSEIKVGENSFCRCECNFTHDGNTVVCINLLCAFIQKNNNCRRCGGNISFLKIHKSGELL